MERKAIVEKKKEVGEVVKLIEDSKSVIIVEYRGLDVAKITDLRNKLKETNSEMKVIKNSIVKRAASQLGFSDFEEYLVGPNAVIFSTKDAISGASVSAAFAKKNKKLILKAGIVENKIVSGEGLKTLASLPNKEGMIAMFLGVLNAPLTSLAMTIKAVADSK